ncbi:unnamed protein product [Calicophoron daubneyi]|uniref:Protein SHQ1 homolog n=1 Tax=Calicophoron daubneyi TaxID=300641 RepID=A0AAV2T8B3_CALDB
MLTPIFHLEQTEWILKVIVHAPMAKLSELEVCVEDRTFYFTSPPYFLKFEIPGEVCTEEGSFSVEMNNGDITVNLRKNHRGLFRDLNLITKLLNNAKADSTSSQSSYFIQELNTSAPSADLHSEKPNWLHPTSYTLSEDSDDECTTREDEILLTPPTYGFSGSKSGLFKNESDLSYAVDLPDPDKTSPKRRSVLRMAEEKLKFSAQHYLADFFETEAWEFATKVSPPWIDTGSEAETEEVELTADEKHRLITLSSRRVPPASADETDEVERYLGLLDILLAYTYDFRVREGEEMTESGWNIVKLASTLSWFEVFHSLSDLMITFYRRTLTYPLVRNWRFTNTVRRDVASVLCNTHVKSWCLKCLLEVRRMLIAYPGYHVFVDLYLDDYIMWIQFHSNVDYLNALGEDLRKMKIRKSEIGLKLPEVEEIGKQCLKNEQIQNALENLTLSDATELG